MFVRIGTADAARNRPKRTTNGTQTVNHFPIPPKIGRILRQNVRIGGLAQINLYVQDFQGTHLKVGLFRGLDAEELGSSGARDAIDVSDGGSRRFSGISRSTHCEGESVVLVGNQGRMDFR